MDKQHVEVFIEQALAGKCDWISLYHVEEAIPPGGPPHWIDGTVPNQELLDEAHRRKNERYHLSAEQSAKLNLLFEVVLDGWRFELTQLGRSEKIIERYLRAKRPYLLSMLKSSWFLFDQINAEARRRFNQKGTRWAKGITWAKRQNGEEWPKEAVDFLKIHLGQSRGRPDGVEGAKDCHDLITGHSLKTIFTLVQAFAGKHGFPRAYERLYFKNHWTKEILEKTYDDPKMVKYLGIIDDEFTQPAKLAAIANDIDEGELKVKFDDIHRSAMTPQMRETLAKYKEALRDQIETRMSKTDLVKVERDKERVLGKDFKDLAPHHQILTLLGNALDDRFEPAWWEGFDIKSRMNE